MRGLILLLMATLPAAALEIQVPAHVVCGPAREGYPLECDIVNRSAKPVMLGLWSCSKWVNWRTDCKSLDIPAGPCRANVLLGFRLLPGQSHHCTLLLRAERPHVRGHYRLRLYFRNLLAYNKPSGPEIRSSPIDFMIVDKR
jgi:hypothetical protein